MMAVADVKEVTVMKADSVKEEYVAAIIKEETGMETEVLKIEAGNGRIILFYSSFLDWYKKENT